MDDRGVGLGEGAGARVMGGETGVGVRRGILTGGAGAAGVGVGALFQSPHGLFVAAFMAGTGTGVGVRMAGAGLGGSDTAGLAALAHTLDSG